MGADDVSFPWTRMLAFCGMQHMNDTCAQRELWRGIQNNKMSRRAGHAIAFFFQALARAVTDARILSNRGSEG